MSEESKTPSEVQQSEQPEIQEQITAKEKPKEKDPKRVAAGKRLAAISQKAKEEKMRRLLESEETISWRQLSLLSLGISVLGYAGYKYFWKKEDQEFVHEKVHVVQQSPNAKHEKEESPKSKTNEAEKEPKRKQRGKPISMFD